MRRARFRAFIALDPPAADRVLSLRRRAEQYPDHTHALMVRAPSLRSPGRVRYFPAEICWDGEEPLRPGDRAEVTIAITDDETAAFFAAGQCFTLWSGGDIGHGTVTRRVFTEYSPY
jgi:hypothetical protein